MICTEAQGPSDGFSKAGGKDVKPIPGTRYNLKHQSPASFFTLCFLSTFVLFLLW